MKIVDTWDRNEFKDYDHFAAKMGKYDEDSLFLAEPVKVKLKELTLESAKKLYADIQKVLEDGLDDGDEDDGTDLADLVDPELSRKMGVVVNTPLFAWQKPEFQEAFRKRAMQVSKMSDFSKEDRDFIKKALASLGQDPWKQPQA